MYRAFLHILWGDNQELQRRLSFDSAVPWKPGVDCGAEYWVQTIPLSSGWDVDSASDAAGDA